MGTQTEPSYERLQTIISRQYPPRFGAAYCPAQLATKEEAPKGSKPSRIKSCILQRELHSMSTIETGGHYVVEYLSSSPLPGGVEILDYQEQKVIPFVEEPHPFAAHPVARGRLLPKIPGTLAIADELGYLKYHPTCRQEGSTELTPYPFRNDLLLFLLDDLGPRCSNLTFKDSEEDFQRSPFKRNQRRKRGPVEREVARHKVEECVFAAADIPTQRVVSAELNVELVRNLALLHPWQLREAGPSMSGAVREDVIGELNEALHAGDRALDVLLALGHQYLFTFEQLKTVFYQAIWTRALLVDLFQPVNIDEPMETERIDPRDVFASWTARRA